MAEVLNFFTVLIVAVFVAGSISFLYASGIRLWAQGVTDSEGNPHLLARTASVVCFVLCVFIVLFALWLMIPVFH